MNSVTVKASDYIPSSEFAYENQTKNDLQHTYSASIASSVNMAEAVLMK
jgi:hypothetical protein